MQLISNHSSQTDAWEKILQMLCIYCKQSFGEMKTALLYGKHIKPKL